MVCLLLLILLWLVQYIRTTWDTCDPSLFKAYCLNVKHLFWTKKCQTSYRDIIKSFTSIILEWKKMSFFFHMLFILLHMRVWSLVKLVDRMGSCIYSFLFVVSLIDVQFSSSLVTQNGLTFQEKGTTGAMINADVSGALWTLITCGTRLCLWIQPLYRFFSFRHHSRLSLTLTFSFLSLSDTS